MNSKFDGLECICDTCAGDGSICYMVGAFYAEPGADFSKACNRYSRRVVTNHEKLFGTPERAARTLNGMECMFRSAGSCAECAIADANDPRLCSLDVDRLLEWLRGDAE